MAHMSIGWIAIPKILRIKTKLGIVRIVFFSNSLSNFKGVTLPETNIFAPENGWLEYDCFLLGRLAYF